jgi:hypothetical protein
MGPADSALAVQVEGAHALVHATVHGEEGLCVLGRCGMGSGPQGGQRERQSARTCCTEVEQR